jgi:hypothetical protein
MNIKWMDKITNEELRRIIQQRPIRKAVKKKKMELDRKHIKQRSRINRENSIRMESAGVQKKR